MRKTPLERFTSKVAQGPGCHPWMGYRNKNRYGIFLIKGRRVRVHRFAYEHYVGLIPDGMTIDHLCRNPACSNQSHLEPVTQRENVLRGISLSAMRAKQTHCKNGHEFTSKNTYVRHGTRWRECRICRTRMVHESRDRAKRLAQEVLSL